MNFTMETGETVEYAYVLITSKAKEGEELPFQTNCWFSTANGMCSTIKDKLLFFFFFSSHYDFFLSFIFSFF